LLQDTSAKSFLSGMKITVGNRYLLTDDRYGICKYYDGRWIGLELELGKGDCSGELDGAQKFTCEAGKGLFVTARNIQMDCGPPL